MKRRRADPIGTAPSGYRPPMTTTPQEPQPEPEIVPSGDPSPIEPNPDDPGPDPTPQII